MSFSDPFLTAFTLGGAVLSGVLAVSRFSLARRSQKTAMSGLVLLASFVLLLYSWMVRQPALADQAATGFYIPALFLYGPALFIFFSIIIQGSNNPQRPDKARRLYLFFLPAALLFIRAAVDSLFGPYSFGQIARGFNADDLETERLLVTAGGSYNLVLTLALAVLLHKRSHGHKGIRLWLLAFFIIVSLVSSILVITAALSARLQLLHHTAFLVSAAVYLGTALHFHFPDFFDELEEAVAAAGSEKETASYSRSLLTNADPEELIEKLNSLMQNEQLYLDEELTLASLAAELDLTSHQLSELLNSRLKETFKQYINRHRIDHACRLLVSQPAMGVLDVAFNTGFQSKSTFNVAFRRITGRSPLEYRRRHSPAVK